MILIDKTNCDKHIGKEVVAWNNGSDYSFKHPLHGYWNNQFQVELARGLYVGYDNCKIMLLEDYF